VFLYPFDPTQIACASTIKLLINDLGPAYIVAVNKGWVQLLTSSLKLGWIRTIYLNNVSD
jgi:hypothetical protein